MLFWASPRTDTPDQAALVDNPLALGRGNLFSPESLATASAFGSCRQRQKRPPAQGKNECGCEAGFKYLRGRVAHAQDDDADRKESEAHFPRGRGGPRRRNSATRRRCFPTRERFTYRELDAAREPAMRAGRWRKASSKGDVVCLLMLNRPEYFLRSGSGSRASAAWWRSSTPISPARRSRIASPSWRRSTSWSPPSCSAPSARRRRSSPATRKSGSRRRRCGSGAPRRSGGGVRRRPSVRSRAADAHHRGPRALHLHERHHRSAQGRQHQPLPPDAGDPRLLPAPWAREPTDRMYDCLPMYHTTGGVLATGAMLIGGGTVVIREKFSAREFWDDVVNGTARMFFYIGELCRYLVTAPPIEAEKHHKIRLCCGNGMRPDVWGRVPGALQHSANPRILRGDRGQCRLFNFDGKPGAVGRLPWYWRTASRSRSSNSTSRRKQPVRGRDGFCVECEAGEIGEVIGQILNDPTSPANRFEGYADKEADRKENSARRVREGRRLVPHRRPDAPGRARLSSISSTASATPSAGRARTSRPRRSPRRSPCSPACWRRTSMACTCPATTARPAWPRWSPTASST